MKLDEKTIENIIAISQTLLKEEWEKVKKEAIKAYTDAKKEANETPISLSTTEAVSKINDLKSEFSDLDSIMASFISGAELDISNLDSIITKFQEL